MMISITAARTFAAALTAAADKAQAQGANGFELTAALQGQDDDARAELQAAIERSSETPP